MPTFLKEMIEQFKGIWGKAKTSQKAALILLTLGTLGSIIGLCLWANTPHYRLLFAKLSPEDAAHIVEGLEERSISYRLTQEGTTISVPSEKVYNLRLKFAAEGFPKSSNTGWEIFDKSSLGMTDFLQDVNYTRALQGELARTLTQMEQVDRATVHIVRPRPTIFKSEEDPVTASIVLKPKRGTKLTVTQINGICQLVANAVEGLTMDRVSILDNTGRVLSQGHVSSENLAASNQLDIQGSIEDRLTAKAQSLLNMAAGPDKSSVRVSVKLKFENKETITETPDPESRVVKMEKIKTKEGTPVSNSSSQPGTGAQTAGSPGGAEEDITKEYEIGRVTETSKKEEVSIEKLSVALLVDETLSESLKKLEGIVQRAVGFDSERGDSLESSAIPFFVPDMEDSSALFKEAEKREFILQLVQYGALTLTALLLFLLIRFLIKKNANTALIAREKGEEGAAKEEGEKVTRKEQIKKNLASALESNPQAVVQLMRAWINQKEA